MDFLVQLDHQLQTKPWYRELVGINSALEVYVEYCQVKDRDSYLYGTANHKKNRFSNRPNYDKC